MSREIPKIKDILDRYALRYAVEEFLDFTQVPLATVPEWFAQEIRFALINRGEDDKEAFTSEFIIVPFLKEAWKKHPKLSLFSHVQITADNTTVIPDYLVSPKDPSGYKTVYKPLLLTVEAKNDNFDEGWAQALFQSVICQKINETPDIPIHSIVTTGDLWEFGKLERSRFTRHPVPWALQNIGGLLGILDAVFSASEASLPRIP